MHSAVGRGRASGCVRADGAAHLLGRVRGGDPTMFRRVSAGTCSLALKRVAQVGRYI